VGSSVGESLHVLENVIFLKKSPLFSSMKTGDLRAVAIIAEEIEFEKGNEIVRENDVGDSMYILKKGTVSITKSAGGKCLELARLGKGDCFGDMAIFDAEVRSASVIASEPCTLLRIDSDNLKDVLIDYPTIGIELLKIFVQRLRKANAAIQELSHHKGEKS